jgi:hypothetical protein
MKKAEANLENGEFDDIGKMPKEESLKCARRISIQFAGFLAAGYFTFTPLTLVHRLVCSWHMAAGLR